MSERDEYDDGGPPGFKDDETAADGQQKRRLQGQQKRRLAGQQKAADGAAKTAAAGAAKGG